MLNFGIEKKLLSMQKALFALSLLCFSLTASAQVEKQNTLDTKVENVSEVEGLPIIEPAQLSDMTSVEAADVEQPADSIHYKVHLPYYMTRPYLFTTWMPTGPFFWGMPLELHEGLNAQIGAGVMVGFGKNNPFKGASFFTDVTLSYAKQLDEHWSVALGGTLSRFKMWNEYQYSGDVFALANYKFDEHWSASIYGSYNHMPNGFSCFGVYSPMDMGRFNENFARFGGEVTYKFNEKFAVSVGVSTDIPTDQSRPWQPQPHNKQGVNPPMTR